MSIKFLLLVGSTTGAATALVWYALDRIGTPATPHHLSEEHSAPTQPEHTEEPLREHVTEPAPVIAPAVSAAAAEAPTEPVMPEPPRISENMEQYKEYLDVVFQHDARDRNWEVEAEGRIRTGIAKVQVPGVHVVSLECRATLCKSIIDSSDQATLNKVTDQIMHGFFWPGPGMYARVSPNNDKDLRLVAFFGREGRELPDG